MSRSSGTYLCSWRRLSGTIRQQLESQGIEKDQVLPRARGALAKKQGCREGLCSAIEQGGLARKQDAIVYFVASPSSRHHNVRGGLIIECWTPLTKVQGTVRQVATARTGFSPGSGSLLWCLALHGGPTTDASPLTLVSLRCWRKWSQRARNLGRIPASGVASGLRAGVCCQLYQLGIPRLGLHSNVSTATGRHFPAANPEVLSCPGPWRVHEVGRGGASSRLAWFDGDVSILARLLG